MEKIKKLITTSNIKSHLLNTSVQNNEFTIECKTEGITNVLLFLRDEKRLQFKMLVSICGVDYPERQERFELVYNLLSIKHNIRIRVKISASEETLVQSVVHIFSNAKWYEREAWDLFGIYFKGNDDLRRILTDYGFEGHPLRKDFPLTGDQEIRYDLENKKVVYEQVRLVQKHREFDFLSPWEGEEYILPGDEKATK